MKTKLLAVVFCSFLGVVHGGEGAGSGGDNVPPDVGAAWFLGEPRTIRACAQIDPKFPLSADDVKKAVQETFDQWTNLYKNYPYGVGKTFILSTRMALADKCAGGEDLSFYFGFHNREILGAKKAFHEPIAFAHKRTYNQKAGWGNGFVWVGSKEETGIDWSSPHLLHGILLHEWGHVFGCDHVPGTIMTAHIGLLLKRTPTAKAKEAFAHIDGTNVLALTWRPAIDYKGGIPTWDGDAKGKFKLFTGKDPVGNITAQVTRSEGSKTAMLTLSNKASSFSIPFTLSYGTEGQTNHPIFKALSGNGSRTVARSGGNTIIEFGTITDATGKKHTLSMQSNVISGWESGILSATNSTRVRIAYDIESDASLGLFTTDPNLQ